MFPTTLTHLRIARHFTPIEVRGRMPADYQAATMRRIDAFNAALPGLAEKAGATFARCRRWARRTRSTASISTPPATRSGMRRSSRECPAHAARIDAGCFERSRAREQAGRAGRLTLSRPLRSSSSTIGTSSTSPASQSGGCRSACRSTAPCMRFTIPDALESGSSGASADLFSSGSIATPLPSAPSAAGNSSCCASRGFIRCIS